MELENSIRNYIDAFVSEHLDVSRIPFQKRVLKTNCSLAGITLPNIRSLAKKIIKDFPLDNIIKVLNFDSLDEQILFCFLVKDCPLADFAMHMDYVLGIADSWAVVDTTTYDFFIKAKDECVSFCNMFLTKDGVLKRRIAFIFMMRYLIEDRTSYVVEKIRAFGNSDEYLLQMAIAWTMQVLFLIDKESVWELLKSKAVCFDIKIKAIQKLIDSRKVSDIDKSLLRELRADLRSSRG